MDGGGPWCSRIQHEVPRFRHDTHHCLELPIGRLCVAWSLKSQTLKDHELDPVQQLKRINIFHCNVQWMHSLTSHFRHPEWLWWHSPCLPKHLIKLRCYLVYGILVTFVTVYCLNYASVKCQSAGKHKLLSPVLVATGVILLLLKFLLNWALAWFRPKFWGRKWQPALVFLPGKSHGQRSLQGTVHGVAKSRTWPSG